MNFKSNVIYDFYNVKYKTHFSGRLSRSKTMEPSLVKRKKYGTEYLPIKEITKSNSDWVQIKR